MDYYNLKNAAFIFCLAIKLVMQLIACLDNEWRRFITSFTFIPTERKVND